MFNTGSGLSLSDIAAVTKDNDGFAGGNGWWVLIILFALFGGWGNNGRYDAAMAATNAGAYDNYVLASDFATLQRQIDSATTDIRQGITSVANGICSLGYDQLAQMNGINSNINSAQNSINAGITNLSYQIQQCCCDNKSALAQLRYDMAQDNCLTRQTILDKLAAMETNALQDKINQLQADNQALKFAASQQAQNAYLISQLGQNNCCCG